MRAHTPSSSVDDDRPDDAGFEPDVVYISTDEWLVLFERDVHDALGIAAAEFVRRYRAGEYEERDPDVMLLSVSITMYDAILAA